MVLVMQIFVTVISIIWSVQSNSSTAISVFLSSYFDTEWLITISQYLFFSTEAVHQVLTGCISAKTSDANKNSSKIRPDNKQENSKENISLQHQRYGRKQRLEKTL